MKRIILGLAAMLMTFGLGVGMYRLIWVRSEVSTPTVETVPAAIVEPVAELAPVVTPVPARPESRIILDYDDETFYPNGGYSFLGATPKEFVEVDSFVLEYSEFVDDQLVPAITVITKHGDDYESNVATFGRVNERGVIFFTSPNGLTGFEYFFEGEFIRTDFDKVNGREKAVLRGTFIKLQRGKKVAERIVNFRIERHDC